MKKYFYVIPAFLAFLLILGILYCVPILLSYTLIFFFGYERAYTLYMDHITAVSMISYLIALLPSAIWYHLAVGRKKGNHKKTHTLKLSHFGAVILLVFALNHAISLLLSILALLLPHATMAYDSLVENGGMTAYSLTWFLAVIVLAPLAEEMIFRGLICHYLKKTRMPFVAVNMIQAALFGCFHMNLIQGIYAFILGLFLGYLAYRYRTVKAAILAHAVFNLCGTVLTALEAAFLSPSMQTTIILLSLPLTYIMLNVIRDQTAD